jgi:cardiolipin synthase A/B
VNIWFPRFTVHSLAIVLSLLTYVLTTRAKHERRAPSIAIAWVLGLIALPYVVLPMYFMFGQRKLVRRIWTWSEGRPTAKHWAEHLIESFGLACAAPSLVRMHQNGAEAQKALFELMESARERLDICTFILGKDPFGEELTARMAACARRGVRVRFLLDGVCAMLLPRACFQHLHEAGVETAVFSPLLARKTQSPRNLRNHRKWLVADGALLWAGGRNFAAEYFCGIPGRPPFLDLSFDLKGPVAAAVVEQFEADWASAGGKAAAPISVSVGAYTEGRAQFLPSGPDQTEDTVQALLIDACFRATQRILAATPYFLPDSSLEAALRLAARRGVKIDLVIPARSNHRLADFARNRSLRSLSDAGVSVHLLRHMNHAKAVVFDQSIALSGSPNLDSRSLLLNYESAVVFYGAREIEWMARWINGLIPNALAFDNRAPALWRDVCEGLLLTVAYQL